MSDPIEKSAVDSKREYMKCWREKNRDRIKSYQRAWREANAADVADYQKKYHAEYRTRETSQEAVFTRNLRKNYQMTPEEFNIHWDVQQGKCAICEAAMLPRGRSSKAAAVDHNHATGVVRGLLCRSCNVGIGALHDDPDILISAAEYLIERGTYAHLKGK